MSIRQVRWLATVAVAIVSVVGASSALAEFYSPSVAQIQGMSNTTDSNNASTIDAITLASDGIHIDVTWRTGQNDDPFGANFGKQNFPRVGLSAYTNGADGGLGLNLTNSMGVKWCLMSDTAIFSQPFVKTAPNWLFYEPLNGGNSIPGDMSLQMSILDFSSAREFDGGIPDTGVVNPDINGEIRINELGLQIVGPGGIIPGDEVRSHIWISQWNVPEPSTALLLLVGMVGLFGRTCRRQG